MIEIDIEREALQNEFIAYMLREICKEEFINSLNKNELSGLDIEDINKLLDIVFFSLKYNNYVHIKNIDINFIISDLLKKYNDLKICKYQLKTESNDMVWDRWMSSKHKLYKNSMNNIDLDLNKIQPEIKEGKVYKFVKEPKYLIKEMGPFIGLKIVKKEEDVLISKQFIDGKNILKDPITEYYVDDNKDDSFTLIKY